MRSPLFLFDDARARRFEPFALTRPAGTLRAGAAPIWNRWQMALQCFVDGFIGAVHLEGFEDGFMPESGTVPRMSNGEVPAGAIIANSRFAPAAEVRALRDATEEEARQRDWSPAASTGVWRAEGRIAAVRVPRSMRVEDVASAASLEDLAPEGAPEDDLRGWWIDEVWDLVRLLPDMLSSDLAVAPRLPYGHERSGDFTEPPAHVTVLGGHPVHLTREVRDDQGQVLVAAPIIEPYVVLDASNGPILVGPGVHIHAFTRINGPCWIGSGTTIMGGDISTCSIGPMCKVRGEMSMTIVSGYANKGHDGFVGHSYLGRWTNLGAGTITSNLKNTYGSVALWTPEGIRDTGMQFLGTLFGDHAKTGIGTRLTTGTVLGAGCNVYGSAMPPKCVPPFAWGEKPPYASYRLDKFLEVAERVMARRKCTLSDDCRRQLAAAYDARWTVDGGAAS